MRADGVASGSVDLRGAAAGQHANVGVRADDGDGVDGAGSQRQNAGFVPQQHDAFFGEALRVVAAPEGIDHVARHNRIVNDSDSEHAAQDAVIHVVEAGQRNCAVLHGLFQTRTEILIARHLLVESGQRGLDGGMRTAPVREHPTLEVEVFFQDLV